MATKNKRSSGAAATAPSSLDLNRVLDAMSNEIMGLSVPEGAKLLGAELSEVWLRQAMPFDRQYRTIGAEVPFFFFADKYTVVVGVQDRIAMGADEYIFGCEWKTAKGTTRYWDEGKWLAKMAMGPQIHIYALAQAEGYFPLAKDATGRDGKKRPAIPQKQKRGACPKGAQGAREEKENGPYLSSAPEPFAHRIHYIPEGSTVIQPDPVSPPLIALNRKEPIIMVRAITKEKPPALWPSHGQEFFAVPRKIMSAVRDALAVKGEMIRAARLSGKTPWQLPGLHCENRFSHTMCSFYERFCEAHRPPKGAGGPGPTDPGRGAYPYVQSLLSIDIDDPRVVILGASAYETASGCLEQYRIEGGEAGEADKFYQGELNVGTALHAGLQAMYSNL